MGVDIPDISRVLIWGLPDNLVTLWQQVGRAGRNYQKAVAIVYIFSKPRKNRVVFPLNICYRQYIIRNFYKCQNFVVVHNACVTNDGDNCNCSYCNCCTFCAGRCPCKSQQ